MSEYDLDSEIEKLLAELEVESTGQTPSTVNKNPPARKVQFQEFPSRRGPQLPPPQFEQSQFPTGQFVQPRFSSSDVPPIIPTRQYSTPKITYVPPEFEKYDVPQMFPSAQRSTRRPSPRRPATPQQIERRRYLKKNPRPREELSPEIKQFISNALANMTEEDYLQLKQISRRSGQKAGQIIKDRIREIDRSFGY